VSATNTGREKIVWMSFPWSAAIGFFLGFAFGVGCALAVMYSIFLGGYRAALRDLELDPAPERLRKERSRRTGGSGRA
jgi:hypothetical protein